MDDLYTPNMTEIEKLFDEEFASKTNRNDPLRRVLTAENAVVDSVLAQNKGGYVTITYRAREGRRESSVVTLVVGPTTRIMDQFGRRMRLRGLSKDMVINARFSSAMTRSIPPQSNAYAITVVKENVTSMIDRGRVISITRDNRFHFLLTGNPNDINSQTRYVISRDTKLRDRRGNRIRVSDIRPGQMVRIERASFQTASIPPQTTALTIQII